MKTTRWPISILRTVKLGGIWKTSTIVAHHPLIGNNHLGEDQILPVAGSHRLASGTDTARREEQRRADENYYPSEAAHHPPTLPSMHQQPPPQPEHLPSVAENARDDHREAYESAARKMDVDEDYDDEGEDEKRGANSAGRNSPRGMLNGQPKQENTS